MARAGLADILSTAIPLLVLGPTLGLGVWEFVLLWDDQHNFLQNEMIRPPLSLEKLSLMVTSVSAPSPRLGGEVCRRTGLIFSLPLPTPSRSGSTSTSRLHGD